MEIDKDKVTTQDDLNEPAPIDQIEGRVEAEMKKIEGKAKRDVADGLGDEELASEGKRLEEEGERDLAKVESEAG